MSVEITTNIAEFDKAMKRWLLLTQQELAKAVNRRMFFLLVRLYVLTPPQNPQAQRDKIRAYLNEPVGDSMNRVSRKTGKRIGNARVFRRVNKIINAARGKAGQKGFYGPAMRKASGSFRKRAIGSVGYLKAPIVLAIRAFNGHFTQWGGKTKKANGREINPNAALIKIGADYGVFASAGNVSMFKGAKAQSRPAQPGWNPVASATMTLATKSDTNRVDSIYTEAMSKALSGETTEILRHLGDVVDETANQACIESPNGRAT